MTKKRTPTLRSERSAKGELLTTEDEKQLVTCRKGCGTHLLRDQLETHESNCTADVS